jgi:hypothetical protein
MNPYASKLHRRDFLARSAGMLALAWSGPRRDLAGARRVPHPQPRPAITAERVLQANQLGKDVSVLKAYAAARSYPAVFDGLHCACECRDTMHHRSLLSCYESKQPTGCVGCQEQAATVARLAGKGKSLEEIRRALDQEFGG